jgi:DNA repair photolyase
MNGDYRGPPHRGRGALSNTTGRFEPYRRQAEEDGWACGGRDEEDEPPRLATTITWDRSKTIIARNESPDVGFDRSINPYRGCEHGCIYCFARPTHAWLGLSPGLDFETRLFVKADAALLLDRELAKPSYRPAVIVLGANTDPYQPVERELRVTRSILEVLWRRRHPVAVVTKSQLILRDLDLLAPMAAERLVRVMVSVTTLDRALARKLEPRAATPPRRVETLRGLSAAGVPTGVLAAPMIPALNDSELERILEAAAEAGAGSAGYVLLRLPLEIKDLFREWLQTHFPGKAKHVLSLVREARGGALYDPTFGRRMRGSGPYAEALERRFRLACKRFGLNRGHVELDASRFRGSGTGGEQLSLFG